MTTDGLVLPPQDELSAKLYEQVLTRMYQADRRPPIALLIAYGGAQNADLQLHRPDECYPAQGFSISGKRHVPVAWGEQTISATMLTGARFDRTEQVLYWSRIARLFPEEARDERRAIISENLAGRMPDGALVRLSEQMRGFAHALAGGLGPTGRRILMGA